MPKVARLFNCFVLLMVTLFAGAQKPNVIFIVGDDVGYEIPTVNGGQSYSTPNIDYMAQHGMNFTHCEASPLCSPSRFMLLTGKYNFRNYSIWGYMNKGEKTIGNLMQDAGYKTGYFGKFQLYGGNSDILSMGFDEYIGFQLYDLPDGSRYKDPVLYQTGGNQLPESAVHNKYADDILTQRLFDFIDRNKSGPFFAYYPMSLCHRPFSPTPDDAAFADWDPNRNNVTDTVFFPSMVKYMDKKIGQIINKLKSSGLENNTLVIFCGDNGTPRGVVSSFDDQDIAGKKGNSTEAGTHVPLMAYWPGHIAPGKVNNQLIDFTDFFPTLANLSDTKDLSSYGALDGKSFYPGLLGQAGNERDWIFCHFDAYPDYDDTARRWIQNKTYKLYDSTGPRTAGFFYNIVKDENEQTPIPDAALTTEERAVKQYFRFILDTMPKPPPFPVLDSTFAINITQNSATIGGRIIYNGGAPLVQAGTMYVHYPSLASFQHNRASLNITRTGVFQQTRNGLVPQTPHSFTLYAMNGNRSDNTGYIKAPGYFITSSNPPTAPPGNFTATPGSLSLTVTWSPAKFPRLRATRGGYLLVYSTTTPTILADPNRRPPPRVVTNGTLVTLSSTVLPASPPIGAWIRHLSRDSVYYFLLIPYTWNGVDSATYSYLTTGAVTVTGIPGPYNSAEDLIISASPNPSSSKFQLSVSNDSSNLPIAVKVISMQGKTLQQINGPVNQTYSFGSSLASGIYLVRVQQGDIVKTIKVVKNR